MLLYGAGGHAKVIAYCMKMLEIRLGGIFDDDPSIQYFEDVQVKHTYETDYLPEQKLVLAFGNNRLRQLKAAIVKHPFGKIVHPSAQICEPDQLDDGTVAFQNVVVQTGAIIGAHVIVNTAALIEHDCTIEDFVHLAPRATLCGHVRIGEGTLIGAGAVVLPGVRVGKWCVVGAGAVVTKDVPDFCTVLGVPARLQGDKL